MNQAMKPIFIIAKTRPGQEYLYSPATAHKVSKASADYICKVCNHYNFKLKEGECWHVYEVGMYETAYDYAQYQKFTVRNGIVKEYA